MTSLQETDGVHEECISAQLSAQPRNCYERNRKLSNECVMELMSFTLQETFLQILKKGIIVVTRTPGSAWKAVLA